MAPRGGYGYRNRGGSGRAAHRSASFANAIGHHPGSSSTEGASRDWAQLEQDLVSIDRKQYGAYNRLRGCYSHHTEFAFDLHVEHIQGDPFAPPSRVRAVMEWAQTGFPPEFLATEIHKIALCDFVTRQAAAGIRANHLDQNAHSDKGWSGPKGGAFNINNCGQEILPRTSALIPSNAQTIELRFVVSLPAAGRNILGQKAFQILGINLVKLVKASLLYENLNRIDLHRHVDCAYTQHYLREQLIACNLVSFIANGSVLPRSSGASQLPMTGTSAVPFQSPPELEVALNLPDGSGVSGMGIRRGITLLTGGGFHGKSTLLNAIERGVYNHVPGDGRELVVTDPSAMKIRAEDGRSVAKVDITPFITNLPGGKDTTAFSTEDASGSTSMAANIQEALEAGCQSLLIDEDSSATNLLIRDQRMQNLIRHEPITPFISKARALFTNYGVSTIIVIGGLGDWLSVADHVLAMGHYIPRSITQEARAVIKQYPSIVPQTDTFGPIPTRTFQVDLTGLRDPYASRASFITMNRQARDVVDDPSQAEAGVDLSALDQIVEIGQARTLAVVIQRIAVLTAGGRGLTFRDIVNSPSVQSAVGLEKCCGADMVGGQLVGVRAVELLAALSRLRGTALRVGRVLS